MENERKLPHDKVLRVTEIAQAAVVAHAEAHGVSKQEAADSLILTGAAAERALVEALEADAPEAPAGVLLDRDRTFVALSEEALGVVDSWTVQGGHADRAAATSDLVMRAGRRLASLVAWRKKQPPRKKREELFVGTVTVAKAAPAPALESVAEVSPKRQSAAPEFYVPGEVVDLAEFKRVGRMRRSDAPSDLAWGQVMEISRVVQRAGGPVAIYCENAEAYAAHKRHRAEERARWGEKFEASANLLRNQARTCVEFRPQAWGIELFAWLNAEIERAGQLDSDAARAKALSAIRAEMNKRSDAAREAAQ